MTEDNREHAFESSDSAQDGELADSLAVESSLSEQAPPPASAEASTASAAPAEDSSGPSEPAGQTTADEPSDRRGRRWRRGRRSGSSGGKRRKAPWWELPALVLVAIVVAILVKTFLVQPFYIPSQSMEKTLHGCPGCSGDRILVNKPIYDLRDPHPGDIVVFDAPPGWKEEPASQPPSNPVVRVVRGFGQLIGFVPPDGLVLVKRVIAIGGQSVKGIAGRDGHPDEVMVRTGSGPWRTLNEPYVFEDGTDMHAAFGPVTVPKGRLWVMGDHRNDSADSRYHCDVSGGGNFGANCDPTTSTVPIGDVIGKAFVIAWPPSRWRTLGTPATFEHAALGDGAAIPLAASLAVVLPVGLRRRRRRSRRR